MRFSVDAHAIGRNLTGNEVYVRNLLNGFAALDRTSEFIAYVSVEDAGAWVPGRFTLRRVAANPYVRLGIDLSRKLRRDRPDLLHVQYTAPLVCPVPVVVSVHDVSYLEHPEYFPLPRALQLRCTVRRTIRSAARILTPSEFSRQSIMRVYRDYGLDESSVVVVHNAVSSEFRSVDRAQAAAEIRIPFGIPAPFILTVGDLQLRKNQAGLIQAFKELLHHHPELPHHLVLVGQESWYGSQARKAAHNSGLGDRIHFTGFLPDRDLRRFYGACDVFVFPSFYEGFGLPILEAMACGRAVACSNTSAMPEVADAAAILFDPRSTGEMMRAMRDLVLDGELRSRMERLGLHRASAFSWETTARKTLEVYYEAAGDRDRAEPVKMKSIPVSHP